MPLVREGRDRIAGLMTGAETCHWGSSGTSIWVGSSTAAHSGATTWLNAAGGVGATQETGFPLRATNVLQFRGIYSTAQANFQWEQWLINSSTASGAGAPMNIAVQQALGVKANTQSWQLTACVTITT